MIESICDIIWSHLLEKGRMIGRGSAESESLCAVRVHAVMDHLPRADIDLNLSTASPMDCMRYSTSSIVFSLPRVTLREP